MILLASGDVFMICYTAASVYIYASVIACLTQCFLFLCLGRVLVKTFNCLPSLTKCFIGGYFACFAVLLIPCAWSMLLGWQNGMVF